MLLRTIKDVLRATENDLIDLLGHASTERVPDPLYTMSTGLPRTSELLGARSP
jgi:hypothetical protein